MSVNGSCYLNLLNEVVWPTFRSSATQKSLWWMQDGAPAHCTKDAKEFLLEKFRGKVISRGIDIAWPAHSPDINQLDFHFWVLAQRQVYASNPLLLMKSWISLNNMQLDAVRSFEDGSVECAEADQAQPGGKQWSFPASGKKSSR